MKNAKTVRGPLLATLDGAVTHPPPIWFMRQAGRYLPEYRKVRAEAGGFVELCLDPKLATEVTLQPVKRFGLDAAILFSDILIVPYALGVPLWFEEGEGPRLDPVTNERKLAATREQLDQSIVDPVYEAVDKVRTGLPADVALIGFCGAPWTVATYLIAGRGTDDQGPAKALMRDREKLFANIIERLIDATAQHLIGQLRAGADVVQLFDTWAGALPADAFERWCVTPTRKIVEMVRAAMPDGRVIVFPKGVGIAGIEDLARACRANAISLDQSVDRTGARQRLAADFALQGNLDPVVLLRGGAPLDRAIDQVNDDFRGIRHVFNLGHGIHKETPVEHVERMVERVRRAR